MGHTQRNANAQEDPPSSRHRRVLLLTCPERLTAASAQKRSHMQAEKAPPAVAQQEASAASGAPAEAASSKVARSVSQQSSRSRLRLGPTTSKSGGHIAACVGEHVRVWPPASRLTACLHACLPACWRVCHRRRCQHEDLDRRVAGFARRVGVRPVLPQAGRDEDTGHFRK